MLRRDTRPHKHLGGWAHWFLVIQFLGILGLVFLKVVKNLHHSKMTLNYLPQRLKKERKNTSPLIENESKGGGNEYPTMTIKSPPLSSKKKKGPPL